VSKREPLDPRERMIRAAVELLASGGREAVSTRAVCAAAHVQTPTIYRHFGDMQGLLDAAVSRCLENYLQAKRTRPREADPVDDLRRGWDLHVEFGLANPGVYALLYGEPRPDNRPEAVREGEAMLRGLIERIARAGRLRVNPDRAVQMIHSACRGVTLSLISTPMAERDQGLSAATREAVLTALTTDTSSARADDDDLRARHAVALKAALAEPTGFTRAETGLLVEWLDRLSGNSLRR
jgi:AcrR family transcriptional regulator